MWVIFFVLKYLVNSSTHTLSMQTPIIIYPYLRNYLRRHPYLRTAEQFTRINYKKLQGHPNYKDKLQGHPTYVTALVYLKNK